MIIFVSFRPFSYLMRLIKSLQPFILTAPNISYLRQWMQFFLPEYRKNERNVYLSDKPSFEWTLWKQRVAFQRRRKHKRLYHLNSITTNNRTEHNTLSLYYNNKMSVEHFWWKKSDNLYSDGIFLVFVFVYVRLYRRTRIIWYISFHFISSPS